jgi:hypothetical protein
LDGRHGRSLGMESIVANLLQARASVSIFLLQKKLMYNVGVSFSFITERTT